MEPYDAEKVTLSNELYSQLMQPDLNYTKYVQIISKSEPLLQIMEEREKKAKQEEQERIEEERKVEKKTNIIGCIVILILIIKLSQVI